MYLKRTLVYMLWSRAPHPPSYDGSYHDTWYNWEWNPNQTLSLHAPSLLEFLFIGSVVVILSSKIAGINGNAGALSGGGIK